MFYNFEFDLFTMPVQFFNNDLKFILPEKKRIKQYLCILFTTEGVALKKLDYIFCTDEYLLGINIEFLHHSTYTDVITFPLSAPGEAIEGEIYISVDRVKENAFLFKKTFHEELLRVIFHGALHLCGYKDKSKSQIKIMRDKENYYLSGFNMLNSSTGHSFTLKQ